MKKSILALALIGALSMLGACSSDNDDGINGVSGNFAKEPISGAKLELVKLGDADAKVVAEAKTDNAGAFNFAGVDLGVPYLVKVATDGLADAKLMNTGTGTALDTTNPAIAAFIGAGSEIIVAPGEVAQFNPIGITATKKVLADLGLTTAAKITEAQAIEASSSAAIKVDAIIDNLVAVAGITDINIDKAKIASGAWSPNLEYAMQLTTLSGLGFDALLNPALNLSGVSISAQDIAKAKENADAASKATGSTDTVKSDPINHVAIVKTYLFNTKTPSVIIPDQINASNSTKYYLNGTVYGANASLYKDIVKAGTVDVTKLINAQSITATISPLDSGVSLIDTNNKEFKLDLTSIIEPTSNVTVRIDTTFTNNEKSDKSFTIVLGSDATNASILTTRP